MLSSTDPIYNSTKEKAVSALNYIIPLLKKYKFKWVITGGFASYIHGAKRPISDIDIDIFASKEDENFKQFLQEISSYSEEGLVHGRDEKYDNYSIDLDIEGQIIDICPVKELLIYSEKENRYLPLPFYSDNFTPEVKTFQGYDLNVLPIKNIIENKEILQREVDIRDLKELKKLLN